MATFRLPLTNDPDPRLLSGAAWVEDRRTGRRLTFPLDARDMRVIQSGRAEFHGVGLSELVCLGAVVERPKRRRWFAGGRRERGSA